MSQPADIGQVAVVCAPNDPRRAAATNQVGDPGSAEIKWFTSTELHDLDRLIRRGSIVRVIFASWPDLLQGIWDEEIELDEWPRDVRIEFVHAPQGREAAESTLKSWQQWRQTHRRRQVIAGLLLSVIVLGLSFCLCVWLAR